MLPGAPPFVEANVVTEARRLASRLGSSDLPILIEGPLGTGRRTLANALGTLRGRGVITFNAFDGMESLRRHRLADANVVLHHLHVLDPRAQNELASLTRKERFWLVATVDASHALSPDLAALVDASRVVLAPLRKRGSDTLEWARLFLRDAAAQLGRRELRLTPDAELGLGRQTWPGNLTELQSVIQRAAALAPTDDVDASTLGFAEVTSLRVQPLSDAVDAFRMEYVTKVLAHFGGNRTQAAHALRIDPRTIFRYLAKTKPV